MKLIIEEEDIEWIVNQLGELGVRVAGQNFYLYKGTSLRYDNKNKMDIDSNGNDPTKWRYVKKREFGEVCSRPEDSPAWDNAAFDWEDQ